MARYPLYHPTPKKRRITDASDTVSIWYSGLESNPESRQRQATHMYSRSVQSLPWHTVIGRPIEVEQIKRPSLEQILQVHAVYVRRLQELYDDCKHLYQQRKADLNIVDFIFWSTISRVCVDMSEMDRNHTPCESHNLQKIIDGRHLHSRFKKHYGRCAPSHGKIKGCQCWAPRGAECWSRTHVLVPAVPCWTRLIA